MDITNKIGIIYGSNAQHFIKVNEVSVLAKRFPDGEIGVEIQKNIRGQDIFIVQPTCPPVNEALMELLITIDACKRASAKRVTAVIPYFGYARQDRKDKPRVPITSKLVSNLLIASGVDRIVTLDLHSDQIQGFFDIPVDHLRAYPLITNHIKAGGDFDPSTACIVSTDAGGAKGAEKYANHLGCGFAIVSKVRKSDVDVKSSSIVGDVKGKVCYVIDDMTSSGSTLIAASKLIKENGGKKTIGIVTHLVSGIDSLIPKIVDHFDEFAFSNSIPHSELNEKLFLENQRRLKKIKVLAIDELLDRAINSIHYDQSISVLFQI